MATYNGVINGFSGKAGSLVGSMWRGRHILKAKPVYKKNRRASSDQLMQRKSFKLVTDFLHGIDDLIQITFPKTGVRSSFNIALQWNLREAVDKNGEEPALVYEQIRIAYGNLPGVGNITQAEIDVRELKIAWENILVRKAQPTDLVGLVAYCPELGQFVATENAAMRSTYEAFLNLGAFKGKAVHCWIFTMRSDFSVSSNSQYLGEFNIPA